LVNGLRQVVFAKTLAQGAVPGRTAFCFLLFDEKLLGRVWVLIRIAAALRRGLTIFTLTPAPDPPGGIVFYTFFTYPFYIIADYARKGVALGRGNSQVLNMRIRHAGYYDQFLALNSQHATAADVPLADNKGVWRH
jgi:hypothetical protein